MNVKKIAVIKSNKHYRVSDVYNRQGPRWEQDRQVILTDPQYKETFLYHYLVNKKKEQDIETFKRVVYKIGSEKHYPKPTDTELVVHLRMGDSMGTNDEFNVSDRIPDLINKFDEIRNALQCNAQINKISVVTALHFGDCEIEDKYHYDIETYERNISFLLDLEEKINALGYNVSLVSNQDIDRDIYYMACSKHFIKSISNLTRVIISNCVDKTCQIYN